MGETDTEAETDGRELEVSRDQSVYVEENLIVRTQRGTGTNDRDTVTKESTRQAEIDVGDSVDLPKLFTEREIASNVNDAKSAMSEARDFQPDEEE